MDGTPLCKPNPPPGARKPSWGFLWPWGTVAHLGRLIPWAKSTGKYTHRPRGSCNCRWREINERYLAVPRACGVRAAAAHICRRVCSTAPPRPPQTQRVSGDRLVTVWAPTPTVGSFPRGCPRGGRARTRTPPRYHAVAEGTRSVRAAEPPRAPIWSVSMVCTGHRVVAPRYRPLKHSGSCPRRPCSTRAPALWRWGAGRTGSLWRRDHTSVELRQARGHRLGRLPPRRACRTGRRCPSSCRQQEVQSSPEEGCTSSA